MPEIMESVPPEASVAKVTSYGDDHLNHLLVPSVERPWFRNLYESIRDAINPPKLPPLQVTSKPVAVKDIWGLYRLNKRSWAMSTGLQVAVVTLLFTVFSIKTVQKVAQVITPVFVPDIAPYQPKMAPKKDTMQGGGGGGDNSPLPPS